MKPPLRIAHASDIHLDTDYYGGDSNVTSRDFCRGVFGRLLERIVAEHPDLMLLPGDLFDSNRASTETILWSMERLAGLPFPVVMIPGNHDCLDPQGIYLNHDFSQLPNLDILLDAEGENRRLDKLEVTVWGKGMVDHTPQFRPLEGLPAPEPGRWNLGLGHGIYVGREGNGFRSSPVQAQQIGASQYDYIALGHHHALLDVSNSTTAAYYCGAPIPISDDLQGTFLIINLRDGEHPQITIHNLE